MLVIRYDSAFVSFRLTSSRPGFDPVGATAGRGTSQAGSTQSGPERMAPMEKEWNVLVVSALMHRRKYLLNTFQGFPINPFVVSTSQQAREMLSSLSFALVFCEEITADGSYRELLSEVRATDTQTRFVVMLSTSEWDGCLGALRLGVADAIPSPLQSTDIESILLHTIRGDSGEGSLRATA